MKLLKIGSLNNPKDRWEDAVGTFSEIDVFCFNTEVELNNSNIHYKKFNITDCINKFLFICARHYNLNKKTKFLCDLFIIMLRVYNFRLLRDIRNNNYDYIHSSYNDFDESAFLTMLLNPKVYTRAQKETRLYYSYFEEIVFRKASRIVLNDSLNQKLYEHKYGSGVFKNKEIIYELDEDVRKQQLRNSIQYDQKLSSIDGKIHAVILAGRVLSNPNDSRSGGRLFYVNMIKELLNSGIVVHLHTGNIIPFNGSNPYEELEKKNGNFHIGEKLDFSNNTNNAYKILSRYDIGICHAHLPDCEVTEFDKVNIPHRYYEYHLAHVTPVDIVGGNLLLEKKAEKKHALIVNSFSELELEKLRDISWDTPSFAGYIKELYFK